MEETQMMIHQGGLGSGFVFILQYLKNKNWFPWVSQNSASINRWAGIAFAIATSVGLKYALTETAGGGWHLAIDIPSLPTVGDVVLHALTQYSGQEMLYHVAVKDTLGDTAKKQMVEGTVGTAVVQVAVGKLMDTENKDA